MYHEGKTLYGSSQGFLKCRSAEFVDRNSDVQISDSHQQQKSVVPVKGTKRLSQKLGYCVFASSNIISCSHNSINMVLVTIFYRHVKVSRLAKLAF